MLITSVKLAFLREPSCKQTLLDTIAESEPSNVPACRWAYREQVHVKRTGPCQEVSSCWTIGELSCKGQDFSGRCPHPLLNLFTFSQDPFVVSQFDRPGGPEHDRLHRRRCPF